MSYLPNMKKKEVSNRPATAALSVRDSKKRPIFATGVWDSEPLAPDLQQRFLEVLQPPRCMSLLDFDFQYEYML